MTVVMCDIPLWTIALLYNLHFMVDFIQYVHLLLHSVTLLLITFIPAMLCPCMCSCHFLKKHCLTGAKLNFISVEFDHHQAQQKWLFWDR